MYTKGDFHMHSTNSDGDYSPKELIIQSKECGLDIISITDHNRLNGLCETIHYGNLYNIKIIPGVEISCKYNGLKVHVLGYFNENIININELSESLKLIKKKDFTNDYLLPISNLKPDILSNKISVKSAINFIHYFKGVAILAHPCKLQFGIFNELLSLDFNGIEAKYFKNTPCDTNFFLSLCRKYNLIYTAGSDFHTDKREDKRHGKLGSTYLNSNEIYYLLQSLNYL
ncbi:MAG: PHP domain-containing protein [Clostridium sp.]